MKENALYILREAVDVLPKNYFAGKVYQLVEEREIGALDNYDFIDVILTDSREKDENIENREINKKEDRSVREPLKDYRFKSMYLSGFRKFPLRDDCLWGINMKNKSYRPSSVFLIGGNGSGKTSLFGAMEYVCTDKVSSAAMRGFEKNKLNKYITYGNNSIDTPKVYIDTLAGTISNEKSDNTIDIQKIKPYLSPFFCSEYDITRINAYSKGINEFIYEQTGHGYIYQLIRKLESEKDKILLFVKQHEGRAEEEKIEIHSKGDINDEIDYLSAVTIDILNMIKKSENEDWQLETKEFLENVKKDSNHSLYSTKIDIKDDNALTDYIQKCNGAIINTMEQLQREYEIIKRLFGKTTYVFKLYLEQYNKCVEITQSRERRRIPVIGFNQDLKVQYNAFMKLEFEDFDKKREWVLADLNSVMNYIWNNNALEAVAELLRQKVVRLKELKESRNGIEQESVKSKLLRYNRHYSELDEFIKVLNDKLSLRMTLVTKITKKMVEEVLNMFEMPDEKFIVDEKDGKISIQIKLEVENGIEAPFAPREFLNSFRFKLYCVSLKIALAFSIKRLMRINFPLVFDDIFYSSDFSNRGMVEQFIQKIYELHDTFFKEEESALQIIFLTHDELVLNSAQRGVSRLSNTIPMIWGRLFDYRVCMPIDMAMCDNNKRFKNLYSTIAD